MGSERTRASLSEGAEKVIAAEEVPSTLLGAFDGVWGDMPWRIESRY